MTICASAKTYFGGRGIFTFTMNDVFEISETSVENVLKSTPKAARLFLDWHTACVGCGFARFCTLKDVISTYQLDEKIILEEIEKLIAQKP